MALSQVSSEIVDFLREPDATHPASHPAGNQQTNKDRGSASSVPHPSGESDESSNSSTRSSTTFPQVAPVGDLRRHPDIVEWLPDNIPFGVVHIDTINLDNAVKLGEGCQAKVWRIKAAVTGEPLVFKEFISRIDLSAFAKELFMAAGLANCLNVVHYRAVVVKEDPPKTGVLVPRGLLMEDAGQSLDSWARAAAITSPRMDQSTICQRLTDICRDVLYGLQEVHSLQAVHRDVRPPNIAVKPSDQRVHATLIDLGIGDVGLREAEADIWSLGTTMLWCAATMFGEDSWHTPPSQATKLHSLFTYMTTVALTAEEALRLLDSDSFDTLQPATPNTDEQDAFLIREGRDLLDRALVDVDDADLKEELRQQVRRTKSATTVQLALVRAAHYLIENAFAESLVLPDNAFTGSRFYAKHIAGFLECYSQPTVHSEITFHMRLLRTDILIATGMPEDAAIALHNCASLSIQHGDKAARQREIALRWTRIAPRPVPLTEEPAPALQ